MAEAFVDLGIRTELVDAARAADHPRPSPLQVAAVPVLRRGGNVVLEAAPGAGVVAAYALGLLDRLADSEAPVEPLRPRMLVLTPTPETAGRVAVSVARFARAVGLRTAALAPGWAGGDGGPGVVVADPAAALAAVRASRLKLDAVEAVVVDGLAAQLELHGRESVDTLIGLVPSDAQRVIAGDAFPDVAEHFIEAHVRRALHIPPRRAAGEPEAAVSEPAATIGYVVVPDDEKTEAAAILVLEHASDGTVVLFCRTERRAADLAEALSLRGFTAGVDETAREPAVVATAAGEPTAEPAGRISYDLPFDGDGLEARHADGGRVVVAPREVAHLRRLARDAGFALRADALPVPERAATGIDEFRDLLRRAAAEEDLAAQWLVLEPLLAEFTAAELAAAAGALLRRRAPAPSAAPRRAAGRVVETPTGPAPAAWVRLFISIGRRDNVGPGDIVGAITGETDASGDQIGRIEIKDTFSIVEVADEVAQEVIRRMNGITLKGRSLRVDYDRKPSRGGGAPRARSGRR